MGPPGFDVVETSGRPAAGGDRRQVTRNANTQHDIETVSEEAARGILALEAMLAEQTSDVLVSV